MKFNVLSIFYVFILEATSEDIKRQNIKLSTPEECLRPCDGIPKICEYDFTLEYYNTLGGACNVSKPNSTISVSPIYPCIFADGVEKGILTVNRMSPGPTIQVCEGDLVVVNVRNKMDGMETSIHWHGMHQRGTPYYDGVPSVTQCPIPVGNSFRYQWVADPAGTHFWHSHAGFQDLNGIRGGLVVRQEKTKDPNNELYDFDLPDHVVFISDLMHTYAESRFPGMLFTKKGQLPDNILINGKGQYTDRKTGNSTKTPLEIFNVQKGKRYRFRMIDAMVTVCAVQLFIENHELTVVALDGAPIKPVVVDSIVASSGHRFDFVINPKNERKDYWIQVKGVGECEFERIQQLAILRYDGGSKTLSTRPSYDNGLPKGKVLNPEDFDCHLQREQAICITQMESAEDIDENLIKETPDVKIHLPFKFQDYKLKELFTPNTYNTFMVSINDRHLYSTINGFSYHAPSSALLSQYADTDSDKFCNNKPKDCGKKCPCIHKINIPLNQIAEIVLIDEDPANELNHPFHMHGYYFHVMDMGRGPYDPTKTASKMSTKNWPKKDTITVPSGGYVVLRMKADNPGLWFFHCHFQYHMVMGMNVILHVGELSDLPPVPKDFPKCGDFIPDIDTNLII
ncbi:unnamed protein product [Brassicogethes aeneus]|uniref:Uncharacterized protein n=1 Tax=Brassicogethes aeneus TaxID=1431903 RepID=A0A9P0FCE7_BRAAE|nr:unnamed protein product [Brassicogethes aeneus]